MDETANQSPLEVDEAELAIQTRLSDARAEAILHQERISRSQLGRLTVNALAECLQNFVDSGSISKSEAREVWQEVAKVFSPVSFDCPFKNTYTVTVEDENGKTLFEIEAVEAEDGDEAVDKVSENLNVRTKTIKYEIEHPDSYSVAFGSMDAEYEVMDDTVIGSLSITAVEDED